jgi:hypothetical protein
LEWEGKAGTSFRILADVRFTELACFTSELLKQSVVSFSLNSMSTSEKSEVSAPVANVSSKELAMKYMSLAIDNSPKQVQPYLKKVSPVVLQLIDLIEKLTPIVEKLYAKAMELWVKIEPYKPHLLAPAFMGFIMCFFGGSFLTLIAAVEAFNMCGYESTLACINMLVEDFKIVIAENKKDDKEDKDGDGVADVMQVSNTKLLTRKTLLLLKVIDPNRITLALSGITAGGMAVVAALKLRVSDYCACLVFPHSPACHNPYLPPPHHISSIFTVRQDYRAGQRHRELHRAARGPLRAAAHREGAPGGVQEVGAPRHGLHHQVLRR